MENLCGKDLIKLLKLIDVETGNVTSESVDWIFYNDKTKDMLYWLCTYVNENNVENAHELYEKRLLEKKGAILTGDRFEEKVNELNITHPGIFDISSVDINQLLREVEREETRAKYLEKTSTKYLTLDYKIQQQIAKLENENLTEESQRDYVLNNCFKVSKEIDTSNGEIQDNMRKYSDILSNYNKFVDEIYFLSQRPLDPYKQEDENYDMYLNMWIEKEFDVDEAIRSVKSNQRLANKSFTDSNLIGREFERINIAIQESIIKRVRAECYMVELESRIEYTDKNYSVRCYEPEQRIKLNSSINSLTEEFNGICETELLQVVEKYTRNLIDNILLSQAESKMKKCRTMMNKLNNLNSEVKRAFAQNVLLALLFKSEKRKIESTIKFLSSSNASLTNQQKEVLEKNEIMNMLESNYLSYKEKPIEQREKCISDFLALVTGDYRNKNLTIKDTLSIVQKQKNSVDNLRQELIVSHQKHLSTVKKIDTKLREVKNFIYSGPTNQPVIIPYSFYETMFELQSNLARGIDKQNNCKQTYKNIIEDTFSNKWMKNKKMLYVWFLTEPKKVIYAIQQLEEHLLGKIKKEDLNQTVVENKNTKDKKQTVRTGILLDL